VMNGLSEPILTVPSIDAVEHHHHHHHHYHIGQREWPGDIGGVVGDARGGAGAGAVGAATDEAGIAGAADGKFESGKTIRHRPSRWRLNFWRSRKKVSSNGGSP
jgi:hypothetical protein